MLKRIGEVSKMLSTTTRTIRYYEQVGLIRPHCLQENGYRLYSDQEMILLDQILALTELGFSLPAVKQMVLCSRDGDGITREQIRTLVKVQGKAVCEQISILQETLTLLHDLDVALQLNSGEPLSFASSISKMIGRNTALRQNWQDTWSFDEWAEWYDQSVYKRRAGYDPHLSYDSVLGLVASMVSPETDVLDIGIGTGNLAAKLQRLRCRITGVDQSEAMLRKAREKLPGATLLPGHFLALPLPDQSVDTIVSTYALHHLAEEEKQLAVVEMFRVLRPGGAIIIGDNMFLDEAARQHEQERLFAAGQEQVWAEIEDEFLGNVSSLVTWFHEHGRRTRYHQEDQYTWVVWTE